MAKTAKITRVVGNRGAFGSPSKKRETPRRNAGEILSYMIAGSNPGRKANMTKKNYHHKPARKNYRKNTGKRRNTGTQMVLGRHQQHHNRGNTGKCEFPKNNYRHNRRRRNPGTGSVGEIITTSTFVLVGALGSKVGAQLVLGANNTGVVGYAGNLAVGAALWFVTDKVMKNNTAASGVIAGTVAALILRLLNDYTPIGSYIQNLGMGDYQMQSYVTPQILQDPLANADIQIPPGWAPKIMAPVAAAAPKASMGTQPVAASASGGGMSGLYGGGRSSRGLYSV